VDWSNEEYVKVYRRETDDDLILTWQARALWAAMLIKFDRAGLLETRRGVRGLAALVRIPLDVVQAVLPELLEDGRVLEVPLGYFAPYFLAAQEASKSDKLRQRDSRARRAALAKSSALLLRGDVTNRDRTSRELAAGDEPDLGLALPPGDKIEGADPDVTNRDEPITDRDQWSRQAVTNRDQTSRAVTAGHAASHAVTLSSADPDPEDLSPARARAIPPSGEPSTAPEAGPNRPPPGTPAPGERQEARTLWHELEQARAEAAVELGVEAQPLTAFDLGEQDLREMLAAARARGPAELDKLVRQARHAIAMAKLETIRGEQPFDWFTGAIFRPNNFRRLAGKVATPTTRAGPRGSAERAPEPLPRKIKNLTRP
jgi:hypothetical protein